MPSRRLLLVCMVLSAMSLYPEWTSAQDSDWQNRNTILLRDIQTADYYELVSMARENGLPTGGNVQQLQNRLMNHYSLSASEAPEESDEEGIRVRVDSAQETQFYQVDEVGQDMLILTGGVVLYMEDQEEGRQHKVQADRVIFNQSEEIITAQGNIIYSLERSGGDTEEYHGETLTFRLQNWSGAFASGTTLRERSIQDEPLEFRYSGEFITRSNSDVVVMEDGSITSSTADPPNYRIKADKIWIFAPGEWGLRHAVLYVGRVPLFYFPFYFNQGDDFFFSPGLADFPREGQAVFTTTYLYGQGEDSEEPPISVLQLADEPDRSGKRHIEGLFYRESQPETDSRESEDESDDKPDDARMLRIMADMYSNLGAFLAIEGKFPELANWRNTHFFDGLGRTREIYSYSGGYSPWFDGEDGLESMWHSPYLLGARFPFRYGFAYSGMIQILNQPLNVDFAYYSDPSFREEQSRRNENFQVLQIVTNPDPPTPSENTINSYSWHISGNSIRLPAAAPYLNTLNLTRYSTRLEWNAKAIAADKIDAALQQSSPMRRFFVPNLLVLPSAELNIAGNIVDTRRTATPETLQNKGLPEGEGMFSLAPPWQDTEEEHSGIDSGLFQLPALRPSIQQAASVAPVHYTLSYSSRPEISIQAENLARIISHPRELKFTPRYWDGRLISSESIKQNISFLSNYAVIENSLNGDSQYRWVWDKADEFQSLDWNSVRHKSFQDSFFRLKTTNSLTLKPLSAYDHVRNSSLKYVFDTQIGEYVLDTDEILDFDNPKYTWDGDPFDTESITSHRLTSLFEYTIRSHTQSLSVGYELPPLKPRTTYSAAFSYGWNWYSGRNSWQVVQEEDAELEWQPVNFTNRLEINPQYYFNQTGSYNLKEERVDSLRFSARTGFFQGNVNFSYTQPVYFSRDELAWLQQGEEELVATDGGITANYSYIPEPFWKRRLSVSVNVQSNLTMKFQRFTESRMNFELDLLLDLHELFRIEFGSSSTNSAIYAYIPELAEQIGVPSLNIVEDILNGFRFWDEESRRSSNFNLYTIDVSAVYRMGDWDLSVLYTGKPELLDDRSQYEWNNVLSIDLVWKPIPELSTEVTIDDEGIEY